MFILTCLEVTDPSVIRLEALWLRMQSLGPHLVKFWRGGRSDRRYDKLQKLRVEQFDRQVLGCLLLLPRRGRLLKGFPRLIGVQPGGPGSQVALVLVLWRAGRPMLVGLCVFWKDPVAVG